LESKGLIIIAHGRAVTSHITCNNRIVEFFGYLGLTYLLFVFCILVNFTWMFLSVFPWTYTNSTD